jgi:enoyl-CoA hydratase/carnithine racemase
VSLTLLSFGLSLTAFCSLISLFCTSPSVELVRSHPRKLALSMLFSAQPIGADEALRGGLVSEVVRVGAAAVGAETSTASASAGSAASASGATGAAVSGSAAGSATSSASRSAFAGSGAASAGSAASATVAHGHHGNGAHHNKAAAIGTNGISISDSDRLIAATQRRVTELARAIAAYSPHIVQLGKAAVLEQVRAHVRVSSCDISGCPYIFGASVFMRILDFGNLVRVCALRVAHYYVCAGV